MACRCHEGDIFVPWLTCNASVACSSDDCGTWRERREDARLAQSLGRGLMSVPSESQHKVRFGAFELDLRTAELRKSGQELTLQGQPFQILTLLMDRPGELVTREELKKGTLGLRHVCRFRAQSQQGSEPVEGGTGRQRRTAEVCRDPSPEGIPVDRTRHPERE